LNANISQRVAATDLRGGGSFNSLFLQIISECHSEKKIWITKYEFWFSFAEVIVHIKWPILLRHEVQELTAFTS